MDLNDITIGQLFGAATLSVIAVYTAIATIERLRENRRLNRRRR